MHVYLQKKIGSYTKITLLGETLEGKAYLDYLDTVIRKAYFEKNEIAIDYMWYLWCGKDSPFFGKDRMTTFEQYFVDNKEVQKEHKIPYYKYITDEEFCKKVLRDFGISEEYSHIINGHVPVKAKDGESPVKAGGKLIVIDGGFAKAYQSTTGIAGYTLTYNSNGLVLAMNEPFESKNKAIEEGLDIKSQTILKENILTRKRVADTDIGEKLKEEINDLKQLLISYKEGVIKESV